MWKEKTIGIVISLMLFITAVIALINEGIS